MNEFERKEWEMKKALLGTCLDPGTAAEGVRMIPPECKPTIIRARCTYCSDKKKWIIRNRTFQGIYFATKKEAEEFAEIGRFEIPTKNVRKKYIIIANFCCHCQEYGEDDKPFIKQAKLVERKV